MWELDYKESWVLKNWCFWTVGLEKTLESPWDCKEIKPVHAKENQSWILIGSTDAEAETPILWPSDVKNWLIWPWCWERSVRLFATSWITAQQAFLSITNSWSSLRLTSIESVMPSNNLILCRPLLLPSIFPSIRVFSNELVLYIRWPKYWSFRFSISPSNDYSGLISFRMDWFDLLAVQGTLKSLLQHHSSKASILQRSVFFMVQLSHPYMTTGKTIALTRQTFVGKDPYL